MTTSNDYSVLLPVAYLPPVQYFTKFFISSSIVIERYENYTRQTIRNRCCIYGANEKICLSIPVKKTTSGKIRTKDVQIDYDTYWQKQHWKSIESGYRNSPFFQYYEDDFAPFYHQKEKYLFDYDMKLLEVLLSLLNIDAQYKYSESYIVETKDNLNDFRTCISEKRRLAKSDPLFIPKPYYQVFSDRHGFIENLSVIDLLFNEGNASKEILTSSCSKS